MLGHNSIHVSNMRREGATTYSTVDYACHADQRLHLHESSDGKQASPVQGYVRIYSTVEWSLIRLNTPPPPPCWDPCCRVVVVLPVRNDVCVHMHSLQGQFQGKCTGLARVAELRRRFARDQWIETREVGGNDWRGREIDLPFGMTTYVHVS